MIMGFLSGERPPPTSASPAEMTSFPCQAEAGNAHRVQRVLPHGRKVVEYNEKLTMRFTSFLRSDGIAQRPHRFNTLNIFLGGHCEKAHLTGSITIS